MCLESLKSKTYLRIGPLTTNSSAYKRTMRILHVIISLDPAIGGPPAVVPRLAAAQAALGYEVHLATYRFTQHGCAAHESLRNIPFFEKVGKHELDPPNRLERLTARRARRGLSDLAAGIDILHLHGVWDPIVRVAADVARSASLPYAVTPHGMLDPWSLRQSAAKKRIALLLGYRKMLTGACFLHALNADEKRLIEPLELACPIEVIPNGVFCEEIEPLPVQGKFYAACASLQGAPYVLFLSRLHYKKGLDYLAEAFALLARENPRVHLVVAGPDGGERGAFERRVQALGIDDRVHLVGPLYGPDKGAALADAACFCLPSRQEGFSMAVTEALACGVPPVISEACHFPEVAEVGAGEVVPLEASAIAAALERVLSDPQRRERMAAAGRKLVASRYTWPRVAEQTLEAYRRHGVLGATQHPARRTV
jgi:glycosyltransferase involved in cell wall biosynthesis